MVEALKSQGSVTINVSLVTSLKRDGRQWIACCPAVDVITQATTKAAAIKALREAVSLWFESCIERGVLERALFEAGFKKAKKGSAVPAAGGRVTVQKNKPVEETSRIEVAIPAYIAAQMLGQQRGHAAC